MDPGHVTYARTAIFRLEFAPEVSADYVEVRIGQPVTSTQKIDSDKNPTKNSFKLNLQTAHKPDHVVHVSASAV